MKILMQFPIAEMSGKTAPVGGIVLYNSKGSQFARSWVVPNNPKTDEQVAIRNIMTQCSQAFQSVTLSEKAGWTTYCQQKPITIYTKDYKLSEISAYNRINTFRLIDGGSVDDVAPVLFADFVATDLSTLSAPVGLASLQFTITHNLSSISTEKWVAYLTPSLPSVVYKPKKSDYRLCAGVDAGSIQVVTASPQTFTVTGPIFTNYNNGDYVGVKVKPLSDEYDPGLDFEKVLQITIS